MWTLKKQLFQIIVLLIRLAPSSDLPPFDEFFFGKFLALQKKKGFADQRSVVGLVAASTAEGESWRLRAPSAEY